MTDTIYRKPAYKRLRWFIKQYAVGGNYASDTTGPFDITASFRRDSVIDTTFCYKTVGSVTTKVIVRIDTVIKDSNTCARFTFPAPGKWVVDLIITNVDTCDRDNPRVIIVGNKIDININDTIFCLGEAVKPWASIKYWWRRLPPQPPYDPYDYWDDHTRNPASGGLGNKEVYWFNWGDGGPYIKMDTNIRTLREHTYANTGTYTFKVAWKDSDGCYDTLVMKDLIHVVKPHANFFLPQKNIVCDQFIQFNDSSWIESGLNIYNKYDKILFWTWDFGDGSLKSNQQNPTYRYGKNGDYFVTLKIFTEQGCVDSIVKKIHITGPQPDFDLFPGLNDTGCVAYTVSIVINNSSDTTFRTLNIRWGDGKDTSLVKPVKSIPFGISKIDHQYTTTGHFCIEVYGIDTVFDDNGHQVTCIKKTPCDTCPPICVTVLDYAPAEFTGPDTVCVNVPITVTAKDTSIYDTYTWNFGETGAADTSVLRPAFTATHTYTTPGIYTITYKPTFYYCALTSSKTILVQDTKADFAVVDSLDKPKFVFKNLSTGTSASTTYHWDFGDGKTSTDKDPTHIYALEDTGCKTVTLTIDKNCPSTISRVVCNNYFFVLVVPNVFTPDGDGLNDVFDIKIDGELTYDLSIYNRWGQKMFNATVDDINWNGKVNNTGADAPDGVYYYVFKYSRKSDPDNKITLKGDVTLIRKQ
jgi:gliding motility-associated-like protein